MYREQLSFTIHAGRRTLDLEAPTENDLNTFLQMLNLVKDFIMKEERDNQGKTAIEESQALALQAQEQSDAMANEGGHAEQ